MALAPVLVAPVDFAALLNDAREKYHALMTGQLARVVVDQNGERIEYGPANIRELRAYIANLEASAGICRAPGGPMNVFM